MNIEETLTATLIEQGEELPGTCHHALVAALVAREQEAVDRLQVLAQRFGLMPVIVAKVLQEIGLGEQPTEEQREYVDKGYAELLAQAEQQRQEAIEKYRSIGIEVNAPEFVDPLSADAPESIVIPDTPEG